MDEIGTTNMSLESGEKLVKYFAILAIVIACLGLFGLASFTAEQRTKEMGIYKVLGASMGGFLIFLCHETLPNGFLLPI